MLVIIETGTHTTLYGPYSTSNVALPSARPDILNSRYELPDCMIFIQEYSLFDSRRSTVSSKFSNKVFRALAQGKHIILVTESINFISKTLRDKAFIISIPNKSLPENLDNLFLQAKEVISTKRPSIRDTIYKATKAAPKRMFKSSTAKKKLIGMKPKPKSPKPPKPKSPK